MKFIAAKKSSYSDPRGVLTLLYVAKPPPKCATIEVFYRLLEFEPLGKLLLRSCLSMWPNDLNINPLQIHN